MLGAVLAAAALMVGVVVFSASPAHANGRVDCESSSYACTYGGYAGSDPWGYSASSSRGANGTLHNCTSYAAFRLAQNGVSNPGNLGSAANWAANARAKGIPVFQSSPRVGDIAQWNAGHVAYVDTVNADGSIVVTEDNYGYNVTRRKTITPGSTSPAWPDNFIRFGGGSSSGVTDGTFVVYGGNVFRIAGGAPVYVSSWNAVGGPQPTRTLSDAEWASLRTYPADGTLISSGSTGQVFVIAGGAPLYVGSWSAIGGARPVVTVDQFAIDNGDRGGVLNHIHPYPADGTLINGGSTGQVFVIAGGAPEYVGSWAAIGGSRPVTTVDQWTIDHPDGGSPLNHLHAYPSDGTLINGGSTGQVYVIAGGAPLYVGSWSAIGGPRPVTTVDQAVIDNADAGGVWGHMRWYPADDTYIVGGVSGKVYRVINGVPIYVPSWDSVGGVKPVTTVDDGVIGNAGGTGVWGHLKKAS